MNDNDSVKGELHPRHVSSHVHPVPPIELRVLTIRIPESLYRSIRVAAAEKDMSMNQWCEWVLHGRLRVDAVPKGEV